MDILNGKLFCFHDDEIRRRLEKELLIVDENIKEIEQIEETKEK